MRIARKLRISKKCYCGLARVHFQQIPTRIRLRRNFSSTNSCPQSRRHILLPGPSQVDCSRQRLSIWERRHQERMSLEVHNPKHFTDVIFGSFARFCGVLQATACAVSDGEPCNDSLGTAESYLFLD